MNLLPLDPQPAREDREQARSSTAEDASALFGDISTHADLSFLTQPQPDPAPSSSHPSLSPLPGPFSSFGTTESYRVNGGYEAGDPDIDELARALSSPKDSLAAAYAPPSLSPRRSPLASPTRSPALTAVPQMGQGRASYESKSEISLAEPAYGAPDPAFLRDPARARGARSHPRSSMSSLAQGQEYTGTLPPVPAGAEIPSGVEKRDHLLVPALCDPALLGELPLADPLNSLLQKHIPPHLRPARDLSGQWPPGERASFADAVAINAWRRVARASADRIIAAGAGGEGVGSVLQMWTLRLQALWRLRLSNQLLSELDALCNVLISTPLPSSSPGSSVDPSLSSSQPAPLSPNSARDAVNSRKLIDSPLVPFALRVLRARAPKLRGDIRAAIEACTALLRRCRSRAGEYTRLARKGQATQSEKRSNEVPRVEVPSSEVRDQAREQAAVWRDRALRMGLIVAGLLIEMKDFPSALALLNPLIEPKRGSSKGANTSTETETGTDVIPETDTDPQMLSVLARLHLQSGALSSATSLFTRAHAAAEARISHLSSSSSPSTRESTASAQPESAALRALVSADLALLSVARGQFPEAQHTLEEAIKVQPENGSLIHNLAVAIFYQGRLEEPTRLLEELMRDAPSTATNVEPLLFNLSTFHELRSDDSLTDKRRLLIQVAQWAGEGNSTACLKLN